jgi:hypothetical protein
MRGHLLLVLIIELDDDLGMAPPHPVDGLDLVGRIDP